MGSGNSSSESDSKLKIGFIAQELQDVVPEVVYRYASRKIRTNLLRETIRSLEEILQSGIEEVNRLAWY